jgi:hypothetical protein
MIGGRTAALETLRENPAQTGAARLGYHSRAKR